MRKILLSLTVLAGALAATGKVHAAGPVSQALERPAQVQLVQYHGDWRGREWRRHERHEAWRRHHEWRRWHRHNGW